MQSLLALGLCCAASVSATTCDLFEKGGTPCVAAHSTVRALFAAYAGPLYQVRGVPCDLVLKEPYGNTAVCFIWGNRAISP